MELFLQRLVDGLETGVIYAALALAVVIIFRATGLLNFAQGELAMFSVFIGWMLVDRGYPVAASILGAMVVGFILAGLIERVVIRHVADQGSPLPIVIVTIGVFISLNALAGWIWGYDGKTFPRIFRREIYEVGGVNFTLEGIGLLGVLCILAFLIWLLFQKTKIGLAMRAVASNPESSSLVGIRVGRVLMFGWGFAAALGALAGTLIAPKIFVSPNMMQGVLIYAFAAATLGGFDSLVGAIVGGLVVGVTESLASGYIDFIGSDLKLATAFVVILVVLLVRPSGLFGSKQVHRV